MRLWERIRKDLQDFGRGFMGIHKTWGENLQDFRRGFATLWERIRKTLERIHKDS